MKKLLLICVLLMGMLTAIGEGDFTPLPDGVIEAMRFSPDGVTLQETRFYTWTTHLAITAPVDAVVRYTTDGSRPDEQSPVYEAPIMLFASMDMDFPRTLTLRAKAYFADGTESPVATRTFFAGGALRKGFGTLVFAITGEPEELTGESGILTGENALERGRDNEREVYVEALTGDGTPLFSQAAGMRVYGAASREASIKSLKLFARKAYDPEHGKFETDIFGTVGNKDKVISSYDKLVLRNGGNDFQFGFMRDELNQRLAALAGHTDGEAVLPAVVYLNGKYYSLLWLHESYCDDLLKAKYGGKGDGEYVVIEGKDTETWASSGDELEKHAVQEYNEAYEAFISRDLTDDDVYAELTAFMDVENYLDNFAFNIFVGNNDWPQNNFKLYRFYADGEYREGTHRDGRWRYIYHDMDYTLGLYGQAETQAAFDKLKAVMSEGEMWYSPLFTRLMERKDCRAYFIAEIERLASGALSYLVVKSALTEIQNELDEEMVRYMKYLEKLRKTDERIWASERSYRSNLSQIGDFAKDRVGQMRRFIKNDFDTN